MLCQEIFGVNAYVREVAELYAEEGYVVLAPDLFWRMQPMVDIGYCAGGVAEGVRVLPEVRRRCRHQGHRRLRASLRGRPECTGKVGALGHCLGGKLTYLAAARAGVDCAVGYYGVGIEGHLNEKDKIRCPLVLHFAGRRHAIARRKRRSQIKAAFAEPRRMSRSMSIRRQDHAFARTMGDHFNKPAALMAHSRSIALFRRVMGPQYDLSGLWDKHCEYEFGTRDVAATMKTMVAEPYRQPHPDHDRRRRAATSWRASTSITSSTAIRRTPS